MSEVRYCTITEEEAPQRLDNYLVRILKGVPKSFIYRIIRQGEVRVNKKRAKPETRLVSGDIVRIPPVRVAEQKEVFIGSKLTQTLLEHILYEDAGLLVLNKPAGMAVHGGSGVSFGVIEALRQSRADLHYLELVHRLDRETSGVLVLAKKRSVLRRLHALFAEKTVTKTYFALICGRWQGKRSCLVEAPLLKNILKSGERMVTVHDEGKPSKTHFELIDNFQNACLVKVSPATGRTHQIRVHAQYLGHPIVGDEKYGAHTSMHPAFAAKRLYLHAHSLDFVLEGQPYHFEAPLERIFHQTIEHLRKIESRSQNIISPVGHQNDE